MDQCKYSIAPMQENVKLSYDDGSKEVKENMYKQMVGSLNCLTTTRPDITYYVSGMRRMGNEIWWFQILMKVRIQKKKLMYKW
jgi:hypothetical protein